ncbi:hypothetical protein BP6252_00914 [Coleophoma cylindrospora]|uniref:Uncharacterized protein n=1 Tax=Coleophoma cylindrospora TaxID=1849047 RepID=A0A3D8SRG4_9HELO|nr:hypothetical protein BP6252_00914 [Coleophoma cylindrospora]
MGNVLSLNTISGYFVVLTALGGYWYYTTSTNARGTRRSLPLKPAVKPVEARKEPKEQTKPRKGKKEGVQSGEDVRSEKAAKKKAAQPAAIESKIDTIPVPTKDTDKDGDAEFARRLSSLKTGTILPSKGQIVGPRQKSVKQGRAQEKPVVVETSSDNATAPSSAAGGDADDDQSPISSPEMKATTRADDPVADMLQPASPGASVLRITEANGPVRPKKENRPTAYEAVETKKQRQNRKKAEQKKLALQEQEAERKILMEKQRRTAREAEGRAAKDGSSFMASKAPSSSAWTATPANGQNKAQAGAVDLLDTYEAPVNKAVPQTTASEKRDNQLNGSGLNDLNPEEEREIRRAIQDSQWEEVKKKPRKTKKPASDLEVSETEKPVKQPTDFGVPPVIKSTGPSQRWESAAPTAEDGEAKEYPKEVQDSEWEVS